MCDVCSWLGTPSIYVYVVVIGNRSNPGYRYTYTGIYWNTLSLVLSVDIYHYTYNFLKRGFKKNLFQLTGKMQLFEDNVF